MSEKEKIDHTTAIQIKQFEIIRSALVPVAPVKRYIPKLPNLHPEECLHTFLTRFRESMKAAQIPDIQLVSKLSDILACKVPKTFRTISDKSDDKSSFAAVQKKILASQHLMTESYRQRFLRVTPSSGHSVSNHVSCVKTIATTLTRLYFPTVL